MLKKIFKPFSCLRGSAKAQDPADFDKTQDGPFPHGLVAAAEENRKHDEDGDSADEASGDNNAGTSHEEPTNAESDSAEEESISPATDGPFGAVDLSGVPVDGDDASDCDVEALGDDVWQPMAGNDAKANAEKMSAGHGFFSFCCKSGEDVDDRVTDAVASFINVSAFDDETKENNVPKIDVSDKAACEDYRFIIVKTSYGLPGVDPRDLTADLIGSEDYHEHCQPGSPDFEMSDELPHEDTIRFQKEIIKWVFSITVQLRASMITDSDTLDGLAKIDGRRPDAAALLERTKRDPSKEDSTVKCKSALLYYRVKGGCVVTNMTAVINTSIPGAVAKVMNRQGSDPAEARETMLRSRRYLHNTVGRNRKSDK